MNCRLPFELTLAALKSWSYRWYENGRAMEVVRSSQLLPMSTVPGTMEPVPWAMTYWPPPQMVAVAVGVLVRVGVLVLVRVSVGVGGVPVGVTVGVATVTRPIRPQRF